MSDEIKMEPIAEEVIIPAPEVKPSIAPKRIQYCIYSGCDVNSGTCGPGVSMIRFPQPRDHLAICRRWVKLVGKKNFRAKNVNTFTYICSKHFPDDAVLDFKVNRTLDPYPAEGCVAPKPPKPRAKKAPVVKQEVSEDNGEAFTAVDATVDDAANLNGEQEVQSMSSSAPSETHSEKVPSSISEDVARASSVKQEMAEQQKTNISNEDVIRNSNEEETVFIDAEKGSESFQKVSQQDSSTSQSDSSSKEQQQEITSVTQVFLETDDTVAPSDVDKSVVKTWVVPPTVFDQQQVENIKPEDDNKVNVKDILKVELNTEVQLACTRCKRKVTTKYGANSKLFRKMKRRATGLRAPDLSDLSAIKYVCKNCSYIIKKMPKKKVRAKRPVKAKESPLCPYCGQIFPPGNRFKFHMNKELGIFPFRCKLDDCTFKGHSPSAVRTHQVHEHGLIRPNFSSKTCAKCEKKVINLPQHMSRFHDPNNKFQCQICTYQFPNALSLKVHNRHKHGPLGEFRPKCDCGMTFTDKRALHKHYQKTCKAHPNYEETMPIKCTQCSIRFRTSHALAIHMGRDHSEKRYQCPVCLKQHSSKNLHIRHVQICTKKKAEEEEAKRKAAEEEAKAAEAAKAGSKKGSSKRSTAKNPRDKESILRRRTWKCECGKSFTDKKTLHKHYKKTCKAYPTIEQSLPLGCSQCTNRFRTSHALAIHMGRDHAQKQFECVKCNARHSNKMLHMKHISQCMPNQEIKVVEINNIPQQQQQQQLIAMGDNSNSMVTVDDRVSIVSSERIVSPIVTQEQPPPAQQQQHHYVTFNKVQNQHEIVTYQTVTLQEDQLHRLPAVQYQPQELTRTWITTAANPVTEYTTITNPTQIHTLTPQPAYLPAPYSHFQKQ